MRELELKGKKSKNGKYNSYKGTVGKIADNILKRYFNVDKPFEKLETDVTQFNSATRKHIYHLFWICLIVKYYLIQFTKS